MKDRNINSKALTEIWKILEIIQERRFIDGSDFIRVIFEFEGSYSSKLILKKLQSAEILTFEKTTNANPALEGRDFEIKVDPAKFDAYVEQIKRQLSKNSGAKVRIAYDPISYTLFWGEESFTFQIRGMGSNQATVCKILLTNQDSINKSWETIDFLGEFDLIYKFDDKRKIGEKERMMVYNAANDVNEKIKQLSKGQIEDFLKVSRKTVSVNPKYREWIEFS